MWSYDQSLANLTFLWEKLSNLKFYEDLSSKMFLSQVQNLDPLLGIALKFYNKMVKRGKTKNQKIWQLTPQFREVTEETDRGRPWWHVFDSQTNLIKFVKIRTCPIGLN